MIRLCCFMSLLAATVLGAATVAPAVEPQNYAMLVGCSKYPLNDGIRELKGPVNDVSKWAAFLTDPNGFAFPEGNVIRLVGWPDNKQQRPTYANIAAGFEKLVHSVKQDSRVVILLSGHGVQVPIPDNQDPLDPKNPEPDGLDEVFLPADVRLAESGKLANTLADNQIGDWLDALRKKGAHVLVVFDSCHSGTMTRGGGGVREIDRVVTPEAIGISDAAINASRARAQQRVMAAKAAGQAIPGERAVKASDDVTRGSLVAFYAAQPFETAPELPLPEGAEIAAENYHGMLSFSLLEAITSRKSGLSYNELVRLMSARYRQYRGSRPPTPFAEGDLQREVLGLSVWPNRPVIRIDQNSDGKLTVSAGALHGLTVGTILAVHGSSVNQTNRAAPIGFLRVTSLTASSATVEPCHLDPTTNEQPVPFANLSPEDTCVIYRRDLGDMRIKLFVADESIHSVLASMTSEVREMIESQDKEEKATWLLRLVTPREAANTYGLKEVSENKVFLVHGLGQSTLPNDDLSARRSGSPVYPRVFGTYSATDQASLRDDLERDLPKLFRWENLWKVSAGAASTDQETHGLVVEVARRKDQSDRTGEPITDGILRDKDFVVFRCRNTGPEPLWVTAFYLEANLGIEIVSGTSAGAGETITLRRGQMSINGDSIGQEGLVVFAIPMSVQKTPPDFAMLVQEPLNVAERSKGGDRGGPKSQFEGLLHKAAFNRGTRSFEAESSSTPAILTQAWRLVP